MKFKENDLVMTRVPKKGTNGFTVAGGCIGVVSVVGVALEDGSTNGIEVLFEGDPGSGTYATYNSTQLTHAPAHSPIPESPKTIYKKQRLDRPAELKKFRTTDPMATAIALVNTLYYDAKLDTGDVYIVWFCATLKNWKALVSTNVKDNSYYEVTHNGEQKETYVDRYVKIMNQHFKIPDEYLED